MIDFPFPAYNLKINWKHETLNKTLVFLAVKKWAAVDVEGADFQFAKQSVYFHPDYVY